MVSLDTNVLVRYLVQDDPRQGAIAAELIENHCSEKNPAFITTMVLCETVWVLARAYDFSRSQIAPVLKQILMTDCFEIQDSELVWCATYDYEQGPADFSDYMIAHLGHKFEVDTTYTFDRKAGKHKYMTPLNDGILPFQLSD